MCGRVALHDVDAMRDFLRTHYDIHADTFPDLPKYNIGPKQRLWSIIYDKTNFRIGQIPWGMMIEGKDKSFFNINAKRESLNTFHTFKKMYESSRALIIMNGYYEWQDQGDYKQPFYIHESNNQLMLVAAMWKKEKEGYGLTLMTQPPTDDLSSIHHRMPVLLTYEEGIEYLKFGTLPKTSTVNISYHQVSQEVNSVKHDDPRLILNIDAFYESI